MCIRCRGNAFTKLLPGNSRIYIYKHTDWWEGFMKYAVEVDTCAHAYRFS
jgi:hypothetical protein